MDGQKRTKEQRAMWTNRFTLSNLKRSIRADFGGGDIDQSIRKRMSTDQRLRSWGIDRMSDEAFKQLINFVREQVATHLNRSRKEIQQYLDEIAARLEGGISVNPQLHNEHAEELLLHLKRRLGYYPPGSEITYYFDVPYDSHDVKAILAYVEESMRGLSILNGLKPKCYSALAEWIGEEIVRHLVGSTKRIENSLQELGLRLKGKKSILPNETGAGSLAAI